MRERESDRQIISSSDPCLWSEPLIRGQKLPLFLFGQAAKELSRGEERKTNKNGERKKKIRGLRLSLSWQRTTPKKEEPKPKMLEEKLEEREREN